MSSNKMITEEILHKQVVFTSFDIQDWIGVICVVRKDYEGGYFVQNTKSKTESWMPYEELEGFVLTPEDYPEYFL